MRKNSNEIRFYLCPVGIREQQKTFPTTVLCNIIPSGAQVQVSTSAFYTWSKAPEETDKTVLQKQLEAKAVQLFEENRKTYGSLRLSEAFIKGNYSAQHHKTCGYPLKPGQDSRRLNCTEATHLVRFGVAQRTDIPAVPA